MYHGAAIFLAALAAFILGPTLAVAQEPERGETVTSRTRPELDPLGAHSGGFLLYPKVSIVEEFNDNIFAADNNQEIDFITAVTPGERLRSERNNQALNFEGSATIGR